MIEVISLEDLEKFYPPLKTNMTEEYDDEDKGDFRTWNVSIDGTLFYPEIKVLLKEKMDPGMYTVEYSNQEGFYAKKKDLNIDDLIEIYDDIIDSMVSEIERFWGKSKLFKDSGFIHKRGIMLVGAPGTGKSSLIHIMCKEIEKNKGICFKIESPSDLYNYRIFMGSYFRRIEPTTPVLLIIEDIDKILEVKESELLSILDGQDCVNHQLVIGTSNRLDQLNDLLLRPSRFDWIIEVKNPDKETRTKYFSKLGLKGEELNSFVTKSDKLSIAQMKELFVSVKLLDNDINLVLKRLDENSKVVSSTTFKPPKKAIGFGK